MAELNWAGQIIKDDFRRENNVGKFLAAQNLAAKLDLSSARFEGLDSQRVKVTGVIYRYTRLEPQAREEGPYEQTWIWDTGLREWMLKSWTVGAFSAPAREHGIKND